MLQKRFFLNERLYNKKITSFYYLCASIIKYYK